LTSLGSGNLTMASAFWDKSTSSFLEMPQERNFRYSEDTFGGVNGHAELLK